MPITTLDIVVLIFGIPLWLFHLSMIYFLIRKIESKSKEYYNGFFILFIILGIIDGIYFVVVSCLLTILNKEGNIFYGIISEKNFVENFYKKYIPRGNFMREIDSAHSRSMKTLP
jgi:hypothetical protein